MELLEVLITLFTNVTVPYRVQLRELGTNNNLILLQKMRPLLLLWNFGYWNNQ
jgi:hypothetical protein